MPQLQLVHVNTVRRPHVHHEYIPRGSKERDAATRAERVCYELSVELVWSKLLEASRRELEVFWFHIPAGEL